MFHELGRAPKKGDWVNAHGVALTVIDVSDHTIRRVVIELALEGVAVESDRSQP